LLEQDAPIATRPRYVATSRAWIVGLTSLFFILLQSACTAFMALSGLRLLIGIGSLAAATTGLRWLDSIHGESIRVPMESLAVLGSVINLYAIWRVRSLRARPSSQWRIASASPEKKRAEGIQVGLAVLTLLLVFVEWAFHLRLHASI
jgi:hypothetical protein